MLQNIPRKAQKSQLFLDPEVDFLFCFSFQNRLRTHISWPTRPAACATIMKSGTVADKSPLLTHTMGHCLTLCLQKISQRLFQSSKPGIADCCWIDPFREHSIDLFREHSGKYGVCVWVWGVCVLSELGGGCGNSAWGGIWGGNCFFLRSEPPLRPNTSKSRHT